jgi:glycosyltransferase involved in cell wall biosynthesis
MLQHSDDILRSSMRLLTYCPLPYNGRGPAESCVSLLGHRVSRPVEYHLVTPRARKAVIADIKVTSSLPLVARYMPWGIVSRSGLRNLNEIYRNLLDATSPKDTIAYFWPDPPPDIVRYAQSRGFITVREMTNCYRGTAKRILDDHFRRLKIAPTKSISSESVENERQELSLYDYVFASNDCVEGSLNEAGVSAEKILKTSFGWSPSKYPNARTSDVRRTSNQPGYVEALFVGTICAGKGVPYLLDAWQQSGVPGKLTLVGDIDPELNDIIARTATDSSIEFVKYTESIGYYYNTSDIFIFPSLVEGGPQVVYEAAGSGLPVITTLMGRGRIVEDGVSGLIVNPGDVGGLAAAIARLGESAEFRAMLGERGRQEAGQFSYDVVGAARTEMLLDILEGH